jgi:alkanesulfonate monooxygenase SsuD/methylene tetrahydromethanopterin reductase-like flavin-dependent oxidoreductase (luciferase family)
MRIGIGLPTRSDGIDGTGLLAWAARADELGYASLAVLDRVVDRSHEPLVTLAAAAGVTRRIRLLTSIVLAPTRETTLLARQAASLDALSGGRLTLGVGVGVRRDDYVATGVPFERRGVRLDEQLAVLRRIWGGEAFDDAAGIGPIGASPARPGGPELLVGGYVPAVVRRVVAHGDGFMAPGGGEPAATAALWAEIVEAWNAAARNGRPRWVGSSYVALGPDADEQAAAYIRSAYAFNPALAERRLRGIPTTPKAVRSTVERQAALGLDEFVFRPCAADPALPDRLADVLAGSSIAEFA